jgi:hypothetical protein
MKIDSKELDRHITGNYGEDQFATDPDENDLYQVVLTSLGFVSVKMADAQNALAEMTLIDQEWEPVLNSLSQMYRDLQQFAKNFEEI